MQDPRTRLVVLLAWSSWLAGCNAVLGIHAPVADNILYDGGLPPSPADSADGLPLSGNAAAAPGSGAAGANSSGVSSDVTRWASWPMPNPSATGLANQQSYHVDSADLVTDQVTHLQWQQSVGDESYTWSDASAYCTALALPGGAFRLPTRVELLSLVDYTASNPAIDTAAFPDTPGAYFWSSSLFVTDRTSAWVVNFGPDSGFMSSSELSTKLRVRCVR
jgi:hypothetical protein